MGKGWGTGHRPVLGAGSGEELGARASWLGRAARANPSPLSALGLRFLRQVPIAQVNLDGSGVTAAGVASLLAACPSIVSIRASHLQTLSPEQLSDEELPS